MLLICFCFHFFLHFHLLTWLGSLNDRCIINRRFYPLYFILLFFNFNTFLFTIMNDRLRSSRDRHWWWRSLNQLLSFIFNNNFCFLLRNHHLWTFLIFMRFLFTPLNLYFLSIVRDFLIWRLNQRFHDVSVNINTPLHWYLILFRKALISRIFTQTSNSRCEQCLNLQVLRSVIGRLSFNNHWTRLRSYRFHTHHSSFLSFLPILFRLNSHLLIPLRLDTLFSKIWLNIFSRYQVFLIGFHFNFREFRIYIGG